MPAIRKASSALHTLEPPPPTSPDIAPKLSATSDDTTVPEEPSAVPIEAAHPSLNVIASVVAIHYGIGQAEIGELNPGLTVQPLHLFAYLAGNLSSLPDKEIADYFNVHPFIVIDAQSKIGQINDPKIRASVQLLQTYLQNSDNIDRIETHLKNIASRKPTIDEIQRAVCVHFDVVQADLLSSRRSIVIARPRQVAMYLAKRLTSRSLPDIGRKFGGRDHTTVIHAVRRIEEFIDNSSPIYDPEIAAAVRSLKRQLTPDAPRIAG